MRTLINETNTFFRIAASLELTPQSRILYLSYLQKNNILYWAESFTVSASEMQGLSGLSQSGMQRARKQLIEKGMIIYKNRGSNRAPRYSLPALTDSFVLTILNGTPNNTPVNTTVSTPNNTPVNSPNTLIDKTRQDKTRQDDASAARDFWLSEVNPSEAPFVLQSIDYWVKDFNGQDVIVILGIKEMLENGAKSYKYLDKVLKTWESKKLDTPEKVNKYLAGSYSNNQTNRTAKHNIREDWQVILYKYWQASRMSNSNITVDEFIAQDGSRTSKDKEMLINEIELRGEKI